MKWPIFRRIVVVPRGKIQRLGTAAKKFIQRFAESWGIETLVDPDENATSAENNSSVILLLQVDGDQLVFTADSGVPALTRAAEVADVLGIDLRNSKLTQVPHHGSKRNVGPTILNRILGPKRPSEFYDKNAYISASKEGEPKHPAKKVVNAYKRRGAQVYATQGGLIWHFSSSPNRGWAPAMALPFYEEVEK